MAVGGGFYQLFTRVLPGLEAPGGRRAYHRVATVPSLPSVTSVLLVFLGAACLAHAERGPKNTVTSEAQPLLLVRGGASLAFGWSRTADAAGQTAVFTAAQAEAGRTAYRTHCAGCHASDLGGRDDAPALAGPDFLKTWGPRSTAQLHDFIRTTMPPDGTALTAEEYLAVVAHLLERNGAVAGAQPLDAATAAGIASLTQGRP
jgi:mono/diheme cytochrome c family protein